MPKDDILVDDYPSNNRGETNLSPVAKGVRRRAGIMGGVRDIATTLFEEVVLPNAKSLIREYFVYGLDIMLGNSGQPPRKPNGARIVRPNESTNYNKMSDKRRGSYRDVGSPGSTADVNFATRLEAQTVLTEMYKILDKYSFVTLGDFHNLSGVTSDPLDERYGWRDISDSKIRYGRNGYYVILPETTFRG